LESLLSIVGITIDMTNLEKRAKDTEMLIQTVEQQVSGRALESQQPTTPGKAAANTGYIS
jgi:proteasome assembly chaperone (PAC2) family protein